jgi:protein ImuB
MQEVPLLVHEPAIRYIPPRPGWLLTQPTPWRGQVQQILCGPERIEAGWWEGEEIRRDYYVVETDQGQRAWVFRQAGQQDGMWMLHGWFG